MPGTVLGPGAGPASSGAPASGARGGRSGPGGDGWSGSAPGSSLRGRSACRRRRRRSSHVQLAGRTAPQRSHVQVPSCSVVSATPPSRLLQSSAPRVAAATAGRRFGPIPYPPCRSGRYPIDGGGSISPWAPRTSSTVLYERRLAADLRRHGGLPRHVGVILDGNRRWARELGMAPTEGHRRGAAQIDHLLAWSAELGIPVVTLWLLSHREPARAPTRPSWPSCSRSSRPRWSSWPATAPPRLPDRARRPARGPARADPVDPAGGRAGLARPQRRHPARGRRLRRPGGDRRRRPPAAGRVRRQEPGAGRGRRPGHPDEIARHLYTAGCPTPT
jgi:hypothetical protein